ncbi:MAG TPA: SUMF1/EgtB/PvdO family nonheme iron enzyme [bacterium]|nr:SUMF1/EgtB/PvdO family nonheme iron enzyme [bacterium]
MRKILISTLIVMLSVIISCESNSRVILEFEKPDSGNTGSVDDTGNTTNDIDNGDTENTGDSGDTGNSGDTEISDDTEDNGNTADDSDVDAGDTGNTGPDEIGEMVSVPAGSFMMGCNEAVDDECWSNELPYHEVTLSAYKIDKYEVTAGEYQECVAAGDCSEAHYDDSTCYIYDGNSWVQGIAPDSFREKNKPVVCVEWSQAAAYCKWAGKRLPTEAEWEKAARGTEGAKYPWGNEPKVSCDYAVMSDSNAGGDGCGTGGTMTVGSIEKGKSPYGAYDMIGNVWEWTNDWYGETYYKTAPSENPAGPEYGDYRVSRGGSWLYSFDTILLRTSIRYYHIPDYWLINYGFRCAK